jgi:hypothetical protein
VRDYLRKTDDEMLVVHLPKPPDLAGREPIAPDLAALPADVERLAVRVRETAAADARLRLIGAIQARFGNDFAARVVAASRRGPGLPPGAAPPEDHNP